MGDKFNNDDGLVFTNSFGCPIDAHNFTNRYFERMLKQAGIDDKFTFHDLRHTHATMLFKQGINSKVISERLGHSKTQLTLDVYSHVMPYMQASAVKALDKLIITPKG